METNESLKTQNKKPKVWTLSELNTEDVKSKHSWIILRDQVYDVKEWMDRHPGGDLVLFHSLYHDATVEFTRYHPSNVEKYMVQKFFIGSLEENEAKTLITHSNLSQDFLELEKDLRNKGYFKTDRDFYIREIIKGLVLMALTWCVVLFGPQTSLSFFFASILMATCWHQLAFVGHDTGHNGVSGKLSFDHSLGILVGNCVGGISIGWWKDTHNVHHLVTNDPEHDPDIQHLPFMAVSTRFFTNLFSTYHKKVLKFDGLSKALVKLQHYLYYIIMMLGRFNLYLQSFIFILSNKRCRYIIFEIGGLVLFWGWLNYLLSYIPGIGNKTLFMFFSHALSALLHVQITISHFSMCTEIRTEKEEFFRHQLRTTMDVDCPEWLDWLHGGLQFQVIHHLFPRMPRRNLRKARDEVLKLCKKYDIDYHSYNFISGNIIVINHLKMISSKIN